MGLTRENRAAGCRLHVERIGPAEAVKSPVCVCEFAGQSFAGIVGQDSDVGSVTGREWCDCCRS